MQIARICLGLAVSLLAGPVSAAAATLTLNPVSDSLTGLPGQTVGFGFTFSESGDYAVLSNSAFSGTGTLLTYTDYIGGQFDVAPPNVTETFNATTRSGLGGFVISPSAAPGASESGSITLYYTLYDSNPNLPNFDPVASYVGSDQVSQSVVVSVPQAVSATPEPSALILAFTGVSVLCGGLRRKRI